MINLHIVRGVVRNDSRVLKEAGTLAASGLFSTVEIVGLNEPGLPEEEVINGLRVRRVTLTSKGWSKGFLAQVMKFVEWRARIVRTFARSPLSVVHCHDLDPLPIGVRLKALTGARLVYDAHELQTEQGDPSRARVAVARWTERRLIRDADAMITVSPSIADWYAQAFPGVSPVLVRNVPERPPETVVPVDLRRALDIPLDAVLFIYLGALSPGRGIEELLTAFAGEGVRHHIVFMGSGVLAARVQAASAAAATIHFLPPVPPREVLRYAAGADVGVSMSLDTCLNNRYCLPNKLFESLLAGLPVLVSDLPEQRRLVEFYRAGWHTRPEPASIAAALATIDRAACDRIRAELPSRTTGLSWQQESAALMQVYRRLLGRADTASGARRDAQRERS
jgi:glycosyltransferase involved in cell wall biosynthesis